MNGIDFIALRHIQERVEEAVEMAEKDGNSQARWLLCNVVKDLETFQECKRKEAGQC